MSPATTPPAEAAGKTLPVPSVVTEIGNHAEITGINLVRASCEVVGTLRSGESIATLHFVTRGGANKHKIEPATLVCAFGFDLEARGPTSEGPLVARVSCDYAVQYRFADHDFFANLSEPDSALFAAYNTSLHVWPHAREFVLSLTSKMGLPPVLLPIFRPAQLIGAPDQWMKRQENA